LNQSEKEVELHYQLTIKGKNSGEQNWTSIISGKEETSKLECLTERGTICNVFLVAHMIILDFEDYEFFIEILNKDEVKMQYFQQDIHFKMAYIQESFT